jgi:hypothetical protein
VIGNKKSKALKGRAMMLPPLQGFVLFFEQTQGVALGWYVTGPLALWMAAGQKVHDTL